MGIQENWKNFFKKVIFLLCHYSSSQVTNMHKNKNWEDLDISAQFLEVQRCLVTTYFLYFLIINQITPYFNFLRIWLVLVFASSDSTDKYLYVLGFGFAFFCIW